MMGRLTREFYQRDSRVVAKELLGKVLVVKGKELVINETEAYGGTEDLASHARFGMTKRNQIMWGKGGYLYVYLIYGIYEMANVVTGTMGDPGAVLLRGGVTKVGIQADGPGKLTKYLGIDRTHNGVDLVKSDSIYFESRNIHIGKITATTRVGIAYAGAWAEKKWRYITKIL